MSIKQAIEALEVAQDALDISQSLQESAKSNHHPKTLAAYERVSAALAALRSMPQGEPDVADIIAGALPTSRAHAYELMRQALKDATPHTEAVRMSEAEILDILCGVDADTKRLPPGFAQFARAVEQATAARLGVKMGDV